jgi:type I restriction modification DNA specificity protein
MPPHVKAHLVLPTRKKPKDNGFNKRNALFFISTMTKSFSSFSWGGSSFNVKIIANQLMNIPTKNQQPNYELMETFISAIHKLVIKDVVLYTDKKAMAESHTQTL